MIPIDLAAMKWFNPPPLAEMRNGRLCVRSGDKTDFWQGTYYGFHRDDGHFLHQLRRGDFTATVTFTGRYLHLYDQAGLMIRYDATRWIKCGVELTDGAKHFSIVVTNGHSDWSAFKLDHDFAAMSVRVTRNGDAMFIQYSTDRMPARRMARLAYFDPALTDLAIGPAFCSPQRNGFEAEFLNFNVTDPVSRDIH